MSRGHLPVAHFWYNGISPLRSDNALEHIAKGILYQLCPGMPWISGTSAGTHQYTVLKSVAERKGTPKPAQAGFAFTKVRRYTYFSTISIEGG